MSHLWAGLRFRDVVDVAIVAFVLYRVLLVFRGTVAIQMLAGLGLLMGARLAARQADLRSLSFVLENFWAFWVLALIVLFQPELRRALAHAGRNPLLLRVTGQAGAARRQLLDEIVRASARWGCAPTRSWVCRWRRSSRPSSWGACSNLDRRSTTAPR
jgi:diadenylate cyclase